jgi:hypothetical protein
MSNTNDTTTPTIFSKIIDFQKSMKIIKKSAENS